MKKILNSALYRKELEKVSEQKLPIRKLANKNILVTGATGLIGSAIIDTLMKINELYRCRMVITGMCRNMKKAEERFAPYLERDEFWLLEGDVCVPVWGDADWNYIIHAAGNAHPGAFVKEPVETMQANFLGTMNLLDYARMQKVAPDAVVFISSGEIYGEAPYKIFRETTLGIVDCLKVRACYPESKRAAETLCVSYAREYGINVKIARLGYVYGPNYDEGSTKADVQFLKKAVKGENIILNSAGEQWRSYCYVLDAVYGILFVMLKGEKGQAYNVSDPKGAITIHGLAEKIAELKGIKVMFKDPDILEQAGGSKMKKEVLGVQKLQKLGWRCKTGLEEGLQKTLEILGEGTQRRR